MPVRCWKTTNQYGDDVWACRWGQHGKIYKSKSKARAKAQAERQGRAAYASGYRG